MTTKAFPRLGIAKEMEGNHKERAAAVASGRRISR
jgi:hypothetical protein